MLSGGIDVSQTNKPRISMYRFTFAALVLVLSACQEVPVGADSPRALLQQEDVVLSFATGVSTPGDLSLTDMTTAFEGVEEALAESFDWQEAESTVTNAFRESSPARRAIAEQMLATAMLNSDFVRGQITDETQATAARQVRVLDRYGSAEVAAVRRGLAVVGNQIPPGRQARILRDAEARAEANVAATASARALIDGLPTIAGE